MNDRKSKMILYNDVMMFICFYCKSYQMHTVAGMGLTSITVYPCVCFGLTWLFVVLPLISALRTCSIISL